MRFLTKFLSYLGFHVTDLKMFFYYTLPLEHKQTRPERHTINSNLIALLCFDDMF